MAYRASDPSSLEALLVQALGISDRIGFDHVGAHIATALDALVREMTRRQGQSAMHMALHEVEQ